MSPKLRKVQNESPNEEKKQKKGHKHHKKQHKRPNESEDQTNVGEVGVEKATPLKLTIKIGGQTLGEKSVIKSSIRALNSVSNQSIEDSNEEQLDLSMSYDDEEEDNSRLDEDIPVPDVEEEPDEEEEWLDALEEGRLHEVDDELKKIRDPKLMTARQRALLENKSLKVKSESIKSVVSQESDKTMSEEMIERKLLKDRQRRQQAEEKKEKDKKQTIDRLLRKRQELAQRAKKKKRVETPKITYKNCQNGIFICLPNGIPLEQLMPAPTPPPMAPSPPSPVKCARTGCPNDKKYLCSKTKEPVCGLQCYKEINKI